MQLFFDFLPHFCQYWSNAVFRIGLFSILHNTSEYRVMDYGNVTLMCLLLVNLMFIITWLCSHYIITIMHMWLRLFLLSVFFVYWYCCWYIVRINLLVYWYCSYQFKTLTFKKIKRGRNIQDITYCFNNLRWHACAIQKSVS